MLEEALKGHKCVLQMRAWHVGQNTLTHSAKFGWNSKNFHLCGKALSVFCFLLISAILYLLILNTYLAFAQNMINFWLNAVHSDTKKALSINCIPLWIEFSHWDVLGSINRKFVVKGHYEQEMAPAWFMVCALPAKRPLSPFLWFSLLSTTANTLIRVSTSIWRQITNLDLIVEVLWLQKTTQWRQAVLVLKKEGRWSFS